MDIGPREAETFWTAFLRKLARRGLRGVKPVVFEACERIKARRHDAEAAKAQRRRVAERLRPKLPQARNLPKAGRVSIN